MPVRVESRISTLIPLSPIRPEPLESTTSDQVFAAITLKVVAPNVEAEPILAFQSFVAMAEAVMKMSGPAVPVSSQLVWIQEATDRRDGTTRSARLGAHLPVVRHRADEPELALEELTEAEAHVPD